VQRYRTTPGLAAGWTEAPSASFASWARARVACAGKDAEVIELLEYCDAKEHQSEDRSHPVEEIACQE